ncbi:MAG: hypothetical protein WC628_00115 [Candidatus Omnitrophota bacterium]
MILSGESGRKFTQKESLGREIPIKKYLRSSLEAFSSSLVFGFLRLPLSKSSLKLLFKLS